MKATLFSRLVAVLGIIALSVTVAHAGGSHGTGDSSFTGFECYGINGAEQGVLVNILEVTPQFGPQQNVRVGGGKLICTQVTVTRADGASFDVVSGDQDHLKCFAISGPGLQNPHVVAQLSDPLDQQENVRVEVSRYLCSFASKEILPPGH